MGALAVAAAIGGATAGCHPTGTAVIDPLYSAVLAALVTLAASRARRTSWLILAAVATALSRDFLLIPAVAALGVAFASVFSGRPRQRVGAFIGALAIQVVLRWPHVGFQGLTAIVALVAVVPVLTSAYRQLAKRSRRWVWGAGLVVVVVAIIFAVPAGLGALLAKNPVEAAITNTDGALSAVSNGGTTSGTAKLAAASAELRTAHSRAGSWWTAGARLVPLMAQQRQAIAVATNSAQNLTAAAKKEAATVDVHKFGSLDGQIDLPAIEAAKAPLEALSTQITSAHATLAGVHSGWVVSPIASRLATFNQQLNKAGTNVKLGAQVVQAAPGLLGGEGVRHYFIAFMTPAEARGLDGFIGSFGELTVDNGRISLTRAGPIDELTSALPSGGAKLTGLTQYLARYGNFDVADRFQDVTYSPDFPTVAKVISQMYPQAGGDHIDGVLALDPDGLASLLHFTGPITVPGLAQPLTEANAAQELLKGQYDNPAYNGAGNEARHDFLQNALQLAFAKLVHTSLPGPAELSAVLDPDVRQGRLLFWSDHPGEQPLLRRLSLDGSFPQVGGGDVLALTTQNTAANKIDPYLSRSINDHVSFDPTNGKVTGDVTVTLHNAAPASGLPGDVLGSYPGSGLPNGTNRTWLSIYTPFGLTGATQDGAPLAMGSGLELGVNAYSAYVNIPPGGTVTLVLHLIGQVQAGHSYTVAIRQQPMSIPDRDTVTVTPTNGAAVKGDASWQPGTNVHSKHTFSLSGAS